MGIFGRYLFSSVGKKQVVAITGLGLILFVLAHLAGNLVIYFGAEAYNAYAKKLASLGPLLYFMRAGLIATFFIHIFFTLLVVRENRKARGGNYAVYKSVGDRSFAARTMALSGIIIFAFVIFHLKDFTFANHHGPTSIINGEDLGLYGLVVNSFGVPLRSLFYVLAVFAVGLHVSHAFESLFQSFGLYHARFTPCVMKLSKILGIVVAILYSAIPIYIFFKF